MGDDPLTVALFFLVGLVSGFFSSAPLGPINLWIVSATIKEEFSKVTPFIIGVIISDLCFAGLAIWGYFHFLIGEQTSLYLNYIGGGFLIFLGIHSLVILQKERNKPSDIQSLDEKGGRFQGILTGIIMCGSNPGFLMFWIFVVNFIEKQFSIQFGIMGPILFLLGVACGDGIWFWTLITLIKKGINISNPRILLNIRYGISIGFLLFGFYALGYNTIRT